MQTTNYLYRPVLKRAWEITWSYKKLWWLGLVAVLISSGGEYEIISRAFFNNSSTNIVSSVVSGFQEGAATAVAGGAALSWSAFQAAWPSSALLLGVALLILLISLIIIFAVIAVAVLCQSGLIRNIALHNRNKKPLLKEALQFAWANFWPVFGAVVLLKLVLFALFSLLGWQAGLISGLGAWGVVIYILSFLIFVILALIISFVIKYQIFFILLKKQKMKTALVSAWELFRANWLISLEMALFMFLAYMVAAFIVTFLVLVFVAVSVVVIPLYFPFLAFWIKMIISLVCLIAILLIIFAVTGLITTFQWAGWTVLFDRLVGNEETSKLERVVQDFRELPQVIMGKEI
ncbi:MAG: hypothetical protein WC668_03580 [Patescibacteria group bacterium]|jgi:hypothetical protein